MKKSLLLAAALVALGANAQTLTQNWKTTANTSLSTNEVRQGVGMNGKIYINNKSDQKVYVVDANGIANETLPGGANVGITTDQAGNLVVMNSVFPNTWKSDTAVIKVYNPQTPASVTELSITSDLAAMGRVDYVGKAMGNLATDGVLLLEGGASTGISKLVVADGETNGDDSFVAICEGLSYNNNYTVINAFKEGEDVKYLYVTRNAAPAIIVEDGDNYKVEASLTLPNKGANNGAEIFVMGGKTYVVYPTLPNYTDGFAIAELTKDENGAITATAVATVDPEFNANPNAIQANWLNAEVVSDTKAIIYQYVPGAYCKSFTFGQEQTGINDVNAVKDVKVRKVYENGQVYIIKGDVKYNVMGAQVK